MPASSESTTFRLPRTAYLVVVFLVVGVLPFAFSGDSSTPAGQAAAGPLLLLFLVPILAAVFIARTATIVDDTGITARALLGSRHMLWSEIVGLSVRTTSVYVVLADGVVRLRCVQLAQLSTLTEAAGDRLPKLDRPAAKQPPARQRRR